MLRPLRVEDAEAVARAFERAYGSERSVSPETVRSWLENDSLEPDLLRVVEVDGEVVGYGDLDVREGDVHVDLAAPGHEEAIFAWAEATARHRRAQRVRVVVTEGHPAEEILRERGYDNWRASFRMERSLSDLPTPDMPSGFDFRDLDIEDLDTVRRARNEFFADAPMDHQVSEKEYYANNVKAPGFDPSLWTLAWDGDELAGFVSAFPQSEGNRRLGTVEELGVRARWRRRGLAEALLLTAFHDLARRGLPRVRLGVDAANVAGALRLYEKVGMHVVARWNNWVRAVSDDL